MATKTKARPRAATAVQERQSREPPPEPAEITCHDVKRAALCTTADNHRWVLTYVELSPLGLAATDGKMLCLVNAPGWPYHCLLDPKTVRNVPNDARLAVNGAVQFISRRPGCGEATIAVPHQDPEEISYPKWHSVLPEAGNLQPVATVSLALLRKLLAALQRQPDSSITIYANLDNCLAPLLLTNEDGDLGLLMPHGVGEDHEPRCHFPAALYQALGLQSRTLPPVFILPPRPRPAPPDGQTAASPSNGGGLLG
jgi:hypothetical protein